MMNSQSIVEALSGSDLLSRTRELSRQSCAVEAELLIHLGEIDARKLYLECAFPSILTFCVGELGFSEGAAYNRVAVARAGRQLPAVIEALRSGKVHLAGLRLLAPHLTRENHREVLDEAAGKSKREIEEIVARLAPQPPVPTLIRKLRKQFAAAVKPLSEAIFKVQFTASRRFCDKLRQAQALLRHKIPDGDIASVMELALDVLIEKTSKEWFAIGRKPRADSHESKKTTSRHVPDAIKRAVFERDGGRCTFTDANGRRCAETGALEFDHVDGFARARVHDVDRIRLLCRAHNQHAADLLYGSAFMDQARTARAAARPGTSSNPPPL